jgi:hypothetical protein
VTPLGHALFSFADLLGIARLCSGNDAYDLQDALVQQCRSQGRPFLATMPVRHTFKCDVCGVERGEAELHFEDPRLPLDQPAEHGTWSIPPNVGRFVDIDLSQLHAVLAHARGAPAELESLFAASSSLSKARVFD